MLKVGLVEPALGASISKRGDGVKGEAACGVPEGDPAPLPRARAQLLDPALRVGVDHVLHAEEVPPRQGVRDEALLGRVDGAVCLAEDVEGRVLPARVEVGCLCELGAVCVHVADVAVDVGEG